jgi:hypothetical protein
MVTSYGETSGFSAVNADDLMLVNGGKGSSSSSSSNGIRTTGTTIGGVTIPTGVEIKDGNTTVSVSAGGPLSNPSVTVGVKISF